MVSVVVVVAVGTCVSQLQLIHIDLGGMSFCIIVQTETFHGIISHAGALRKHPLGTNNEVQILLEEGKLPSYWSWGVSISRRGEMPISGDPAKTYAIPDLGWDRRSGKHLDDGVVRGKMCEWRLGRTVGFTRHSAVTH